jgi:outer membrane protein OmpA-like peptidoglycan-associated protein
MRLILPLLLLLASPASVLAQERATGTVQVPVPPPEPRGAVVTTPDGRQVELPAGAAADVRGANVVIERPTAQGSVVTLQNDVLFDFDKSDLRPEATQALERVAELVRQRHPASLRIIGHTDSMGTDSYNQALSERRAEAVRTWLAAQPGMPPMRAEGHGEREPVAPNSTPDGRDNPEGRQQNRRVEIYLDR